MSPWVMFIWALPPKGGSGFPPQTNPPKGGYSAAIPNAASSQGQHERETQGVKHFFKSSRLFIHSRLQR